MSLLEKDASAAEAVAQSAECNSKADGSGVLKEKEKRVVTLTAKAFEQKLERLQNDRKAKLNKASKLREKIKELMQIGDKEGVQCTMGALVELCDDVKCVHDSLLVILPEGEREKHDIWFKAKMICNDEILSEVNRWLNAVQLKKGNKGDECGDEKGSQKGKRDEQDNDDIRPEDSVSNVPSKQVSWRSSRSGKSTNSARIKEEAERAALLAQAASLKERHALEEQEQQLKRRREQLELEAMLAASNAKLEVLASAPDISTTSNGMSSYMSKSKRTANVTELNPMAKEYRPVNHHQAQQGQDWALPIGNSQPTARLTQQASQQSQAGLNQRTGSQMDDHHILPPQPLGPHSFNAQPVEEQQRGNICSIMERQTEITTALAQQQRFMLLPAREIPLFDGNPLQYISFMRAFEQVVEDKVSQSDCLYYLEQFTRGQPRELVRSCQHMAADLGYVKAKELLKQHFGNEYKVASAYMEKVFAWPPIRAEDVNALQAYSLFLRSCCNVMENIQYMQELDMTSNMRIVMSKLPFKLREQWRSVAHNIMHTSDRRALFKDLVEFIEKHVRILSDPLFGDIRDSAPGTGGAKVDRLKSQPGSRFKGNSFATTIAPVHSARDLGERKAVLPENGSTIRSICVCCSQSHSLEECLQFKRKKHQDKMIFLKEKELCFGCLCAGHMSRNCGKRATCGICGQAHPSVLHVDRRDKANAYTERSKDLVRPNTTASKEACGHVGVGSDRCLLSILPVQVKSIQGGRVIQTYAFLDPGSSATFCSEHLMQRLGLSGKQTHFLLQTMGQERVVPANLLFDLEVSSMDSNVFYKLPEVLTQKKMPVSADSIVSEGELAKWSYLAKVQIPSLEANVDLLIGSNAPRILEPWEVINSQGGGPYAIKTVLGWVLNGPLQSNDSSLETEAPSVVVNRISVRRLEEMLHSQYNHDFNERATEDKGPSVEDIKFMEIMENSATLDDGHYSLKLPFKKNNVSLPNNFSVVKQRLLGLKRRFLNNKQFYEEYKMNLNRVISLGYAEQVSEQQLDHSSGRVWYLPHHGVYHPKKRSLRVVFDCGATFKGTSLNQQLLQGPNLTSTLLGVLLRFRLEPVAVMGDIQAMFHQVRVAKEDRDFLRFVWWPEGDLSKEVAEFRMTVHLFGAVSSPSCASFALRKTAADNQSEFPAEVLQTVKENFYVDDCLKSMPSEEEAAFMVKNLITLCQAGGFTLMKWISNSRTTLQTIPEEYRAKDLTELNLDRDQLPLERALGLQWCIESDSFKFKMEIQQRPVTRRGMLSVASSVYDPLGFVAPVVLPAKIMLQELCRRNYGWDETVPQDILQRWFRWLEELDMLSEFKVDRCIKPQGFGQSRHAQLHHFADASETGYGAVTYLRMLNDGNDIHVAFLMGKARVTPLKTVTIPRLELTAAVLAIRVDLMLKAELRLQLQQSIFWTDSTSVLKYIKNEDKRFHTFVANRVSTIRGATKTSQWRYISSKENPADEASRGVRVGDFIHGRRWIEGPSFLSEPEANWTTNVVETIIEPDDQEVKKEVTVNVVSVDGSHDATNRLLTYFSSWSKLKVAVAWLLKWKAILLEKCRRRREEKADGKQSTDNNMPRRRQGLKDKPGGQILSIDDLLGAELAIIRYCQQQRFGEEIAMLSAGKSTVSRRSTIHRLDPRLDDGLLRVGGRLTKSSLPESIKHPLILSKDQNVATLILRHIHQQQGHSGRNHTLSTLRKKYWVTRANSAVRKVIAECFCCKKYNGKMQEQKMADLPEERILPDKPPFTNVGIDYFGPITVRKGRGTDKRYGVILTCLASRAIHLEVADSLNTDACINALRRFICRRGQVSHIISDNGTNFIGAERELREALAALDHGKIQGVLRQRGVKWSFNPPAGSHHGGVWERVIRMVRRILSSVLQQQTLNDDGLHTVMCEAEAILNDRPITKLSDDPNDLEPLTPNHILLMKGNPSLPPGLFEPHDLYLKRRWKQVQYIAELFWKRWVREYLPLLQERQKWNETRRNLKPGDIVVIMDPTAPRGSWPLGRVLEAFRDQKGFVRSVSLQTKSSVIQRPVTKLCLLIEAAG